MRYENSVWPDFRISEFDKLLACALTLTLVQLIAYLVEHKSIHHIYIYDKDRFAYVVINQVSTAIQLLFKKILFRNEKRNKYYNMVDKRAWTIV